MPKRSASNTLNEIVHLLSQQDSLAQLAHALKEVLQDSFHISSLGILEVADAKGQGSATGKGFRAFRIGRSASPGFDKKERDHIIVSFRNLLGNAKVPEKHLDCLLTDIGRIDFFMAQLGQAGEEPERHLILYWRQEGLIPEQAAMLLTVCVLVANQWVWIDRFETLQRSRLHDELTGLYNQKYLEVVLDQELRRAERFAARFAVVFIDLDDFKSINDRYGHLAGSHVLQEVGTLLRETLREVDSIFRYGGDEYVVVLLGADQYTAMLAAERIRATVAAHSFKVDEDVSVRLTCSLGVACYPDHGKTKKALLEAADSQLYRSKDRGKNRVTALAEMEKNL